LFKKIYDNLSELDDFIMSKCPKIGRWAWVSVIQVTK